MTAGQAGAIANVATASSTAPEPDVENNVGRAHVTVCRPGNGPTACLDPFLCYTAKTTKGTKPVTPQTALRVEDVLAVSDFDLTKPFHLCTPTETDGLATLDPNTHLASYRIRDFGRFRKRTGVTVANQFGTLVVDVLKRDLLLVPSAKALTAPTPFVQDTGPDHYTCYRVKVAKGQPQFAAVQATVGDQFTDPPAIFDVKAPTRLCLATNVDGVVQAQPGVHLTCYSVAPAKEQPTHQPRIGVRVGNEFGGAQVNTAKPTEICVPSTLPIT